ncbi:putative motility protein [Clostridium sp.]
MVINQSRVQESAGIALLKKTMDIAEKMQHR